eukprot:CAMPEP_0114413364 /NCGR_PEP_ID=MMETSP0103-20121206/818_1 /TAXON_ID=37642 ORGANISM="Paraphysomonas imperforata, Strain PA2" /NCGR_SAMPLE_ID=MMETSP0103 /ASSEMBLY_ACC=CAM_ASM_000201 /LENGTH=312 /DNA_ID=CAMNT_0001581439 /DNA_START=128 /DNA_END=1063 /DNA_ORIENTATION=+
MTHSQVIPASEGDLEIAAIPCGAVAALAFHSILQKAAPQYVAVVFDAGRSTFRNRLYEPYKQQRSETPSLLRDQFPLAQEVLRYLGARCVKLSDYEADDVMASLGAMAQEEGMRVVHISSDKDMLQLVSSTVVVTDIYHKTVIQESDVVKKYGVLPKMLPDLFALIGDAADNIPGVKGIGPKIATALIKEFGTIECIYEEVATVECLLPHRRLPSALTGIRCNHSKVVKSLQALPLRNVLLFRSLVQLRDNIDRAVLLPNYIDLDKIPVVDGSLRDLFWYIGETPQAKEVLTSLTVCGSLAKSLDDLRAYDA